MKTYISNLTTVLALALLLVSACRDITPSRYALDLPNPPPQWTALLGEPCWRVEWVNPDGEKQTADIPPRGRLSIEIPVTWANPVTAWPYWPEFNLIPGYFKPAGALFPFDASGERLSLSWKAGPDTIFYWELALANEDNYSRIPANFDWPRFRELFNETLDEAVREDPWIVNWRYVAERTVAGNFDRRRIVPEAVESRVIPVPAGLWHGTSPFSKPLVFAEGRTPVFPVGSGVYAWVSEKGILRVNGEAWIFIEWE